MIHDDSLAIRALNTLLRETLFGAPVPPAFAYLLNPGDPGFVETLKALPAEIASAPPGPGRKPVASHANHVLFGLELANRALDGDERAFAEADWDAAWKLETVSASEWGELVGRLRREAGELLRKTEGPREWEEILLTGAFAIAAHAAYHLGAIRQILLDASNPARDGRTSRPGDAPRAPRSL